MPEQESVMQDEILNRLVTDKDVFLAKMDRIISPSSCNQQVDGDTSPYSCTVRTAVWSPVLRHQQIVLSVLTCDSAILLFYKRQDKWIRLNRHQEYIRRTLQEKRQDHLLSHIKSYKQLQSHFYRTGITAITWAAPDETDEFTFLITGSKSGSLYFWRVSVNEEEKEDGGEAQAVDPFRFELRHEWHDSGVGHIVRIHSVSDYLLIGTHSGEVIAVNLSSLLSAAGAVRPVIVWEEKDDLPAEHFLCYKSPSESSFLILLPKGTFLLLIRISVRGANEVVDRREVIVRGRHEMPVTAVCDVSLPEDGSPITCLISSADGLLTRLRLPDDPFTANSAAAAAGIKQEEVSVDGLLKSRSAIYGLTSSPFRVFTAALQTIIPYRDTRIMKEGSLLIIFPNVSFQQTVDWLCAQEQDAPNPDPDQVVEYVMAYRSFLDKGESVEMEDIIVPAQDFAAKSVSSLKVTRHKIRAVRDFLSNNPNDKHQANITLLTDALISIDQLLFQHHASQHMSSARSLSPDQQESVDLMRIWLRKIGKADSLPHESHSSPGKKKRQRRNMSQSASSSSSSDASSGCTPCPICCKDLPLVDQENPVCPDGHVFARCSSSLLLCDPAVCQMEYCSLCRRCYRVPVVWEMRYSCIFCY
jgi:hypothetical protein